MKGFIKTMAIGMIAMSVLFVVVLLIFGGCLLLATDHFVLGGLALSPFFFVMVWMLGVSFRD